MLLPNRKQSAEEGPAQPCAGPSVRFYLIAAMPQPSALSRSASMMPREVMPPSARYQMPGFSRIDQIAVLIGVGLHDKLVLHDLLGQDSREELRGEAYLIEDGSIRQICREGETVLL